MLQPDRGARTSLGLEVLEYRLAIRDRKLLAVGVSAVAVAAIGRLEKDAVLLGVWS